MSNNIYDILNNLSKSTPVSTVEAELIYESVDPRGDIMEAINTLEAKFDKFNCENCCIPFVIYSKQNQKFNLILPKTVHVNKEYVTILKNNYD